MWVAYGIQNLDIPSGKSLHNYGKSPFYCWENSLYFYGHFQKLRQITRGCRKLVEKTLEKHGKTYETYVETKT